MQIAIREVVLLRLQIMRATTALMDVVIHEMSKVLIPPFLGACLIRHDDRSPTPSALCLHATNSAKPRRLDCLDIYLKDMRKNFLVRLSSKSRHTKIEVNIYCKS